MLSRELKNLKNIFLLHDLPLITSITVKNKSCARPTLSHLRRQKINAAKSSTRFSRHHLLVFLVKLVFQSKHHREPENLFPIQGAIFYFGPAVRK